ncbi:DVU3141 family protein [uncultured Desulfovibrio sp.]|uniref:DVU3141 family protein n=1 Tax=uncultured Desulfovibrio sp. TaxID=167968 RepID=UPI00345ABFC7
MKIILSIMLCSALCCAGCATHKNTTAQVSPVEEQLSSPDMALAQYIGSGHAGDSGSFSGTRYGATVNVEVGQPYISGLGQPCRGARLLERSSRKMLAACKGEDGLWRLAPDIFAPGE